MKRISLLTTLAVCCLSSVCSTMAQKPAPADAAIPDQFLPLYRELDETLRQASQTYPFHKEKPRPLVAANLLIATSSYGPAEPDSQRWKDILATLDAFQTLNLNAVHILMLAPDLTLGDTNTFIRYYQRLAREIHSRNLKLYVEQFMNPPFGPHALQGLHDDPQGRQDFLNMLEQHAALVYREIKPDYLSIATEPETMLRWTHLSLSADDLANWIGQVANRLKNSGASPNTLVGAGALTWEPEDFILKFAQQPSLDYVDIHFYALKLKGEDQLAELSSLVRKIRATRPTMKITLGETWLFKVTATVEPKPATYKEGFFRDNFSFWNPLDQQFLRLILGIAQKENISVVAPFFSQFYFTYYTFGDTESAKLPPFPACTTVSWDKALESIRTHQLSPTGQAIRTMLDHAGP